MRKLILLLLNLVFIITISQSQSYISKSGYRIDGEVVGLKDTSIILAYYFGGKQYAIDTAITKHGKFSFSGPDKLDGGMYLIVLPQQQWFDIIISEQKFKFKTSLNNIIGDMIFLNSKENTPFYDYLNFITNKQKDVASIRENMKTATSSKQIELKNKQEGIDNDVLIYRENFLKRNKNIFFTKIIKATIDPVIPQSPLDSTGKIDEGFPFRYYKKHFWDNIDFTDSRILRTPLFFSKMEQYLDKMTAKDPDSIIVSSNTLVKKSKANSEIFKYVVSHITSKYERSKIMGMDAVFVNMVENYYITNMCTWIDSTQLKKIIERAEKIAPNLIGKVAPEFTVYGTPFMKDLNGTTHTLQSVKADYTLLIFYGPTCGHCKKEIPKIKNTLDSLIDLKYNIKTFAVATEFDKEEWRKFIKDQKTESWLNVADISHDKDGNPLASSDWRDKYDIYSTPVIYLLDEKKKILAKRINYKQLAEIITRK
jgi:thiol-disulfide isomerase/thioredoxin